MELARSLSKYKWAIALVAIALFLFYWFEIRPIRISRGCASQASVDARKLIKNKAEIARGTDKGNAYDQLISKNMYLRSDYESFLQKCLLHYGMMAPSRESAAPAPSSEPSA